MITTRTGFIGLGNIGKPMALRLAASEAIELRVFDVAAEPVADLVAAGATAADSVAALGNWADVVCVMVRDDTQVREVLGEVLADLRPRDSMIPLSFVVHSTVSPTTPAELAEEVGRVCGFAVDVVDAPVSGGPMGAADGTLAIMVGASDHGFEAVEPVLSVMGSKVVHAGGLGAGTQFKLARNLLHFVSFTAATEAARLAEAAGLDVKVLGDVVRHTDAITGGPGAILHRETTAPIPEGDFWHGVFSHVRTLGEKDLRFALALADELDVEVPLARLALDRLGPGLGLEPKEGAR
jgi:3-hydroxyisobutyrate dehydrogenase